MIGDERGGMRTLMLRTPTQVSRVIEGMAFGDSCGLPWEGLPLKAIPQDDRGVLDFPRRMVSDETEHALLTLAAIADHSLPFSDALRVRFRRWMLGFPPSLGGATLRSGIRVLLGFRRPGVRSQGNLPLARAAVIGAAVLDPILRAQFVLESTLLTHRDPVTVACAQMVADVVSARLDGREPIVQAHLGEWTGVMHAALASMPIDDVFITLGRLPSSGVTGHAPVTLAVALQRATMHKSVEDAVISTIALGGDVDSAAALAGAFAAASGSSAPSGWESMLDDEMWSVVAPRILAGGDWPRDIGQVRRRNGAQFIWIVRLMFGMRLRARLGTKHR